MIKHGVDYFEECKHKNVELLKTRILRKEYANEKNAVVVAEEKTRGLSYLIKMNDGGYQTITKISVKIL